MTTYFMMYVLFFFFSWLFKRFGRIEMYNKRIALCCFFLVSLVIALRHPSMGGDLGDGKSFGYLHSFSEINSYTWKETIELEEFLNYERGYIIFNKLVGSIFNNTQFFLGVCAVISIAPIFYVIYKQSVNVTLSTFIFLGLPVFMMLFSGLRQAIAIGMCFLSILLIQKKKPLRFAFLIIFASLFHSSAMVFLFAYPAYYIKLNRSFRMVSVFLLGVVFAFRKTIFPVLCEWFGYNDVEMDNNGAITLFLVFVAIYIYAFLLDDSKNQGYLNLFYIACFCQAMAGLHNTVIRIGYYYMLALILLLPQVLRNTKDDTVRIISKAVIPICFIIFALYSFYISSWAEAYPYYWFWQTPI